jgi:hypothetical protein
MILFHPLELNLGRVLLIGDGDMLKDIKMMTELQCLIDGPH